MPGKSEHRTGERSDGVREKESKAKSENRRGKRPDGQDGQTADGGQGYASEPQ
jgi:hypothetical protein